MFDIAPTELLLVAFVALVVIGPKDLPKAMRVVGYWVGRARGVARQFRSGFDTMVREAELEEMEKRWAAENERIMREHPAPASETQEQIGHAAVSHSRDETHLPDDATQVAVMVERPHIEPAPLDPPPTDHDSAGPVSAHGDTVVPSPDRPGRTEGAAS
jgi:sec-independent protein translocase protein TatB